MQHNLLHNMLQIILQKMKCQNQVKNQIQEIQKYQIIHYVVKEKIFKEVFIIEFLSLQIYNQKEIDEQNKQLTQRLQQVKPLLDTQNIEYIKSQTKRKQVKPIIQDKDNKSYQKRIQNAKGELNTNQFALNYDKLKRAMRLRKIQQYENSDKFSPEQGIKRVYINQIKKEKQNKKEINVNNTSQLEQIGIIDLDQIYQIQDQQNGITSDLQIVDLIKLEDADSRCQEQLSQDQYTPKSSSNKQHTFITQFEYQQTELTFNYVEKQFENGIFKGYENQIEQREGPAIIEYKDKTILHCNYKNNMINGNAYVEIPNVNGISIMQLQYLNNNIVEGQIKLESGIYEGQVDNNFILNGIGKITTYYNNIITARFLDGQFDQDYEVQVKINNIFQNIQQKYKQDDNQIYQLEEMPCTFYGKYDKETQYLKGQINFDNYYNQIESFDCYINIYGNIVGQVFIQMKNGNQIIIPDFNNVQQSQNNIVLNGQIIYKEDYIYYGQINLHFQRFGNGKVIQKDKYEIEGTWNNDFISNGIKTYLIDNFKQQINGKIDDFE